MPPLRDPATGRFLAGSGAAAKSAVTIKWFGDKVAADIRIAMRARIRLAIQLLRDRVVVNISRPVTKQTSARTGRVVVDPTSRSRPGEFPKADTTRLLKDIFADMPEGRQLRGIVGTTLDYGLLLETKMDRSFLRRTLFEFAPVIRKILLSGQGAGTRFKLDRF